MPHLILASASTTRQSLLSSAGLCFESRPVRVDEEAIRSSMISEAALPRDIADALAEFKARRGSQKAASALVLGTDQILALDGKVFAKPLHREDAVSQLMQLSGRTHQLHSAAVIYENNRPVWRHVGTATMSMHALTNEEIETYLDRAWPAVQSSVGAYHAEALGSQLFARIDGDWFTVLGLPLLELLSYLRSRGMLAS